MPGDKDDLMHVTWDDEDEHYDVRYLTAWGEWKVITAGPRQDELAAALSAALDEVVG